MESNKNAMVVAVVQLNIDVIGEILSRLRVKDLLRFKSICKTWHHLISSKGFIKLHINNSRLRPIPLRKEYLVPCPQHLRHIHPNPCDVLDNMLLAGTSSDGLACLLNKKFGIIHIWNPAIRQSACNPTKKTPDPIICYWFGLDDNDGDYKLVLGTESYQMHLIRPYLDSRSYKSTKQEFIKANRGSIRFHDELGTFFSGNVYWAVLVFRFDRNGFGLRTVGIDYRTILCYNLREETVGRIALPETRVDYGGNELRLGEIDGCLSALFDVERGYEVWVLKEYGDEGSWTKLVVLDSESPDLFIFNLSPFYSKEMCVESLVSPRQWR